jgi:hypothetical protein
VLTPLVDLETPLAGKVALTRGEAPEPEFRDLAGTYSGSTHPNGGATVTIYPDGRFIWQGGVHWYHYEEYGRVTQDQGELGFVSIPKPGRDNYLTMPYRYRSTRVERLLALDQGVADSTAPYRCRTTRWGERQYLSTTEDHELQSFCRAVLAPKTIHGHVAMLRESDLNKPQTGLPQLPLKVWVGFVLSGMNLRNEQGSLRLALESLIPRSMREARDRRRSAL